MDDIDYHLRGDHCCREILSVLFSLLLRREMAPDEQESNVLETLFPNEVGDWDVSVSDAPLDTVNKRHLRCHDSGVLETLIEQAKATFGFVSWMVVVFRRSDLFESDRVHSVTVNRYLVFAIGARIGDGQESGRFWTRRAR